MIDRTKLAGMARNDIDGFESLWRLSRATVTEVLFPDRNALMSTVWRQGNGIVETDRAISYAVPFANNPAKHFSLRVSITRANIP